MGNERLSNIAVLAIEKEATNVIDLERVVDIFAEKTEVFLWDVELLKFTVV